MKPSAYTVRLQGKRAEYFSSLLRHLSQEVGRVVSAQEVFETFVDISMENSSILQAPDEETSENSET